MGRKNRRQNAGYEPLDLTVPLPERKSFGRGVPDQRSSRDQRIDRLNRQDRLAEMQRDARVNSGINWNVCIVPGCGNELHVFGVRERHEPDQRDHKRHLPMCLDHLAVAVAQSRPRENDPLMVGALASVFERRMVARKAREDAAKAARLARTDGHIYFIRLNGLIKVGWSRDIEQRINSYGPRVKVLALYPGSRDDETNLHRQLRPARALGREWYEDGPILADFITVALEQYGPPRSIGSLLMEPKQVVAGKRHR